MLPPPSPPPPSPPQPPDSPPPPYSPCIGQSLSFEFEYTYLLHSNLGGQGPDTSAPPSIRYLNVASFYLPSAGGAQGRQLSLGTNVHIDIELTATTSYTPYNSSLNGLIGSVAQVNLACNQEVGLRVSLRLSCATARSCLACEDVRLSASAVIECYAAGCACYGTTVFARAECMGGAAAAERAAYSCDQMDTPLTLPGFSMLSMTVFDFNTGQNGDYLEQLTVPGYSYLKTPLRPLSGDTIASTVYVNEAARMFTSTARSSTTDSPTHPRSLTNEQAANGVQFFFKPDDGQIDATFKVLYAGSGTCTGRSLLLPATQSSVAHRRHCPL